MRSVRNQRGAVRSRHQASRCQCPPVAASVPSASLNCRARKGAEALLDAWQREPDFWPGYQASSLEWLATLSPVNEANVKAYTDRIVHLQGERLARS